MKLNDAIQRGQQGDWQTAQIRVSPGNPDQWFLMLGDNEHKSFILADDEDRTIASHDVNELLQLARTIGLKEATVFL